MATIAELAPRVLGKMGVLGAGDDAQAEDLNTAMQKLQAAHASLKKEGLVRWTLSDIPDYAEEPYVSMAAFLAGPDYTRPIPRDLWDWGIVEIQKAVGLSSVGRVSAEYF